ncbi:NAD(P)/FAD-dependent oxidoreductase [Methanogenium sp. MK-MG]|uniref:NAD(P)/FAD-dependent oxidoreductase n=1 Tax=Methanogenium sp. MK-MG TaxID=2599926 RepID=UPI0013E9CD62|nr:NAD(P)/FAD-dependent oxidoreductase [Methanogenium sp. MK-MG]KAF1077967.1 Ferredoxin--NADP reductase [Methanogenium sp. MK-MG]
MTKETDVVIIGAGPAGISAAIQLDRYDIDTILFDKSEPGGLLVNASFVENYPGFPKGISGRDLTDLFKEQLRSKGINVCREEVIAVKKNDGFFNILTSNDLIRSYIVIIASGTTPRKLIRCTIPSGAEGRIFYEINQLRNLKDKTIGIIGSGDAAFDYAVSLSEHNHVIILNRSDRVKCLPPLFEQVTKSVNISYRENISIGKIDVCDEGLILYPEGDGNSGNEGIRVFCLVVAIGRDPSTSFISKYIMADIGSLKDTGRIYMIGDVSNGICRQTAISVGDGVRAAMEIAMRMRDNQI